MPHFKTPGFIHGEVQWFDSGWGIQSKFLQTGTMPSRYPLLKDNQI